jgi:hypothetical protein
LLSLSRPYQPSSRPSSLPTSLSRTSCQSPPCSMMMVDTLPSPLPPSLPLSSLQACIAPFSSTVSVCVVSLHIFTCILTQ